MNEVVELTVYQGQAALGDLLRGHLVQTVRAPCMYTRFNTVCC